jgi:hypothetical protein
MLFHCIMNSLSPSGLTKVVTLESQYKAKVLYSGNLLLKVVIRESHLDTNATSTSIRKQLSSLDTYLPTIGNDITKLNQYVKLLVAGLQARGEKCEDLMHHIFKGYMACSDKNFVSYIQRKQEEYEDDNIEMSSDKLMLIGDNKYKNLIQQGIYNAPSAEEEKLLALETEIKRLKKAAKQKGSDTKEKNGEAKGDGNPPKNKLNKPQWLLKHKAPSEADLKKSRTWNNRKYYWCSNKTGGKCGGKWRCHKPSDCGGTDYYKKRKGITSDKEQGSATKLKLAKALTALNHSQDDSEEEL